MILVARILLEFALCFQVVSALTQGQTLLIILSVRLDVGDMANLLQNHTLQDRLVYDGLGPKKQAMPKALLQRSRGAMGKGT